MRIQVVARTPIRIENDHYCSQTLAVRAKGSVSQNWQYGVCVPSPNPFTAHVHRIKLQLFAS